MDKVSYVLGQSIGMDFRRQNFEINTEIFKKSFQDAFDGVPGSMPPGEMQQIMVSFKNEVQEKQQMQHMQYMQARIEQGKAFLAENRKIEGVRETGSGLQYRVIREGEGRCPGPKDRVETHYEGRTPDGNVFDSSRQRGKSARFRLGGVIKGWQEGLQLMKEGARYEFVIPSELAYGESGSGRAIGPHETLIFDVELLQVE